VTQQMMNPLVIGLQAMVQEARERVEREAASLAAWYDGAKPVSAETPQWPEGSLGHRFLTGTYLGEALDAPCLLTAEIPALDGAVPDLDAQVAADALIGAVAAHYRLRAAG
jgi:hypothetical protein